MKKFAIAAALLMISASAHAGTYSYEGVTIHVRDGCRSSSCVSVDAPGYGYYHGGRSARVAKVHKDTSRIAAAKKDAAPAPAAAAVDAAPAKAPDAAPAKAPDAAPPAAPSDATPAK
jgi:hypothetical protein